MGKENGAAMAANPSSHRKDRIDWSAPPTVNLVATLERPKMKTKHQVILEFVENKGKKKILESEVVTSRTPPQGFEFVPLGNPALTSACKELSREQGVKIFIVSVCLRQPTRQED